MTVVSTSTIAATRIRWGRVVGFAFALEAVLFATLVPLQSVLRVRIWFAVVAAGCVVFGYAAGQLAAYRLTSRASLHGFLVGVLATTIYIVLCQLGPGGLP